MGDRTCGLCGEIAETGHAHRSCGLDLCDGCFLGAVEKRVGHRGFEIARRSWTTRSKSDDSNEVFFHVEITGEIQTPLRVHMRFSKEGVGERLRKWLGRSEEIQVGDDLFDDHVLISSETPELARVVLASEGQQSVVMEAMADLQGIDFDPTPDGCRVTVHTSTSSKSSTAPSGQARTVALALHHLQQASAAAKP